MGSGNSVCVNINLDRPNPFYFAGENVSGSVHVNIKEGKIKVDEIFILLKGETGYTTQRTVHESNGSSHTVTDYHTISFFKAKEVFNNAKMGNDGPMYHAGDYSWRFDIRLPDHLPPSVNQPSHYPFSHYYLKLVIDKPWYKRNTNEILYLTIFPRVDLSQIPQCLSSTFFGNHNRKDVRLKGNIERLGYLPGELISGTLEIENPRRVMLKKIQLVLIQYGRIESNERKETISEMSLPSLDHRNDEHIMDKFSLLVPATYLAPSYEFHTGYDRQSNVSLRYQLEFHVKVEGMFTNFDVPIPVTIGTETNQGSYGREEHETRPFSPNWIRYYPEINSNDHVEPPPDYHSIARFQN